MKYSINELTLKEKLGQMIILGLDVQNVDEKIFNLIREYHIGGVVLYKKSYHDTSSMINLISKLKSANPSNIPMFISIDQENGLVNRFPNEIKRLPSPRKQVENNLVNECNELTIDIMKKIGINMNLAPVLDIDRNHKSRVNGTRSYSANYQEVIKYGTMTIKKYQSLGIIPVGKHFPGHGLAKGDSHFVLPIIKDIHTLHREDYQVFNEVINEGLETVMLGHLRIKGYGFKPTTMNKKIIDKYLSNFKGLIMTDDLQMNYLKYIYGLKKVFINCLIAGNDLIMIKYYPGSDKLYKKLVKAISHNCELENKVNVSVQKILTLKEKYHLNNDQISIGLNTTEINDKISKLCNNK